MGFCVRVCVLDWVRVFLCHSVCVRVDACVSEACSLSISLYWKLVLSLTLSVCVSVCLWFFCHFFLKKKYIYIYNVSNEGERREFILNYIHYFGTLPSPQARSMFSEWDCGVVNGGARPLKASD